MATWHRPRALRSRGDCVASPICPVRRTTDIPPTEPPAHLEYHLSLPLPIRSAFAASSPRVAFDQFHQFHDMAVSVILGRHPSAFERATARALWDAYRGMPKDGPTSTFTALSAATGAGKTVSACVLMAYLAATEGASAAYVAPTIAVANEALTHLRTLADHLGGEIRHFERRPSLILTKFSVAAWSSVHSDRASAKTLADYRDQGVIPAQQYSEGQFKTARLVVSTHERWRHEVTSKLDLGVLKCDGKGRSLVVVDEEPTLDRTIVRQPEDVSALASLLADVTLKDEARHYGFTKAHLAAPALASIHDRMRSVKDSDNQSYLRAAEVVTAADLEALAEVSHQDITERVSALGVADPAAAIDLHSGTLEFLKLASQGRVFFSRRDGSAFYAYGMPVEPQPRHLILDGTADLNGLYAVGTHVSVVSAFSANYSRVSLFAVQPPRHLRGQMRSSGLLKTYSKALEYMRWFVPFLLEQTKPGEHVLVYCKKALLAYELQKLPEFDDSGDRQRYVSTKDGRTIHWCNFGRGRGENRWKDCTAYFRLGDFMLKRADVMAKIAASTGEVYSADQLRRLNAGTVRDARIEQAQAAHLAVTNKQDAARTKMRSLDDDGFAAECRAYMVDCEMSTLYAYKERMFPGAPEYRVITFGHDAVTEKQPKDGAAARIANILLTTDQRQISVGELCERSGVRPDLSTRTFATAEVQRAVTARGWTVTTRKAIGLPGKGKVLVRT